MWEGSCVEGQLLIFRGSFYLELLCSRNPTQSEECLEFTCRADQPPTSLPSSLPPLLFVCVWLSSLDSGFPPSPAFDAFVCHWVQTCSASSLQPFEVLEFLWSYQRLFPPPLSCKRAPLFVVCMLNVVTGDCVSCARGTFRGINWAWSVSHSSQLSFSHWLILQRSSETSLNWLHQQAFDLLLWPPITLELKWKILCFLCIHPAFSYERAKRKEKLIPFVKKFFAIK